MSSEFRPQPESKPDSTPAWGPCPVGEFRRLAGHMVGRRRRTTALRASAVLAAVLTLAVGVRFAVQGDPLSETSPGSTPLAVPSAPPRLPVAPPDALPDPLPAPLAPMAPGHVVDPSQVAEAPPDDHRRLNCRETKALLASFTSGELAPPQQAQVRRHLDACKACRDYFSHLPGHVHCPHCLPRSSTFAAAR